MRLAELADALAGSGPTGGEAASPVRGTAPEAWAATEIRAIDFDSRQVEPGSLFCCVRGEHRDGHDHAPEAVAKGAAALVV